MGILVCALIFFMAGIYIYQKDKSVKDKEQLVKDKERIEAEVEAVGQNLDFLIESLVIKHARVLFKKIRQEERTDEYGKEVGFDAVAAHMAHFLSHVICPEPGYHKFQQKLVSLTVQLILLGKDQNEYELESIRALAGC